MKPETSLFRVVQNAFRYLEPFMRHHEVTDTDGQTEPPLALSRSNDPR